MDKLIRLFLFNRLELRCIVSKIHQILILKTPPQYFNIFLYLPAQ
jgi:hypothetical protein